MKSAADRNLLFGILAVQLDFISRDDLLAAMNAWVQEKHRTLGEILESRGRLSAARLALLEALVTEYVRQHGENVVASLQVLSSVDAVRESLQQVRDAEVEASLTLIGSKSERVEPETTFVPGRRQPGAVISDGQMAKRLRYRILRPHAKGGLGQVSVALDGELHREVALKELQEYHADDADSRSRFVLEAEVTGGLEHPGIVPVYGLGQYDDGRPYYAMRFVKGDSLREAIEAFHSPQAVISAAGAKVAQRANQGAVSPASANRKKNSFQTARNYESLVFRKLLGRFVDVCHAISYAHSRGVLHRDLKPGNIMLGKYGETLVVDWGLAKISGRSDAQSSDERTLHPLSGSGVTPTVTGSVIGTPAYMSPEQASGKLDELGPATDVYSLGATLYHVLTGRAPYWGQTLHEVLRAVQNGRMQKPSILQPNLPKALEVICLRAMSHTPDRRYLSPELLAEDIERYLADEPISGLIEPIAVRARRWMRKNQKLTASTVTLVLAGLVGMFSISVLLAQKNDELLRAGTREHDARMDAEAKRVVAEKAKEQADAARENAQIARIQAESAQKHAELNEQTALQQSELALATLTSVIHDIQGGLRNLPGSERIRHRILTTSLDKLSAVSDQFLIQSGVDETTWQTLVDLGDVILTLGVEESERGLPGGRDELSSRKQSALKLAEKHYRRAVSIARSLVDRDPADTRKRQNLASSHSKLADVSMLLGLANQAVAHCDAALGLTEMVDPELQTLEHQAFAFAFSRPKQLFIVGGLNPLSDEGLQLAKKKEAESESWAAVTKDDAYVAWSSQNLGDMLELRGRLAEALTHYEKAASVYDRLLTENPHNEKLLFRAADCGIRLGSALLKLDRPAEALAVLEHALKSGADAAGKAPSLSNRENLAELQELVADVLLGLERCEDAVPHLRECIRIRKSLVNDNAYDVSRALAVSYCKLGDALMQSGRAHEARDQYELCFQTGESGKGDSRGQRDLAVGYSRLARLYLQHGQKGDALAPAESSVQIFEHLAEAAGENPAARDDLATALVHLGDVFVELEQIEKAINPYRISAGILQEETDRGPFNAAQLHRLILLRERLAASLIRSGWIDAASTEIDETIRRIQIAGDSVPGYVFRQFRIASLCGRLAEAASLSGRPDISRQAIIRKQEILEGLEPPTPECAAIRHSQVCCHCQTAQLALAQGDFPSALESYNRAIALLEQMISAGMNSDWSRRELASVKEESRQISRLQLAMADWETLLQVPVEELPELLSLRGRQCVRQQRMADAAQAAAKIRDLAGATNEQLYDSACVFCLCASSIQPEEGQKLTAEAAARRQGLIADGMATLQLAVKEGWTDFQHLQTDPDLTPLRELPEFKALIPVSNEERTKVRGLPANE